MSIEYLDGLVKAVCPVDGVNSDGIISFKQVATEAQRQAALSVVANYSQVGANKYAKWEAIKADRDRRVETGGFQVAGKWYHSDLHSKTQHLGNKDTARDQLAAGGVMSDALLDPETGGGDCLENFGR